MYFTMYLWRNKTPQRFCRSAEPPRRECADGEQDRRWGGEMCRERRVIGKSGFWKRRFRYMAFLLAALAVFLTGCGRTGQDTGAEEAAGDRQIDGNAAAGGGQDAAAGRTVLVLAASGASPALTARVNAFNESSGEYYVEIREYERAEMSENPIEDFATQLTLDILSGKGPDLVSLDSSWYSPAIASEKLTENLYPYMEADETFHREDYYENILEAFELNGGLYVMPSSFGILTMCGKAEELGCDTDVIAAEGAAGYDVQAVTKSWTMGEMIAAYENSPHAECLTLNDSNWQTLWVVSTGCAGNFVDWETGECRFDTPEFVELLEFSSHFSDKLVLANEGGFSFSGALREGKALLQPDTLSSPWDVANWRILFGTDALLWPGYPTADGEEEKGGGVAEPYGSCLSICVNSTRKEEAWEFIKSFLTPEAQREAEGIPLLRAVSEERIQEALTPEYETVDGERREKVRREILVEGEEIPGLTAITEEDAAVYRSIIENTRRSTCYASGMFDIIREEAGVYYEKDKEAAEVAEIIQNRVRVYVEERMP